MVARQFSDRSHLSESLWRAAFCRCRVACNNLGQNCDVRDQDSRKDRTCIDFALPCTVLRRPTTHLPSTARRSVTYFWPGSSPAVVLWPFLALVCRATGSVLPARLIKNCTMRIAEPSPFGLTFLVAITRAIVSASLVYKPSGGYVETVFTFPLHLRSLPLRCDADFFARLRRLRFFEAIILMPQTSKRDIRTANLRKPARPSPASRRSSLAAPPLPSELARPLPRSPTSVRRRYTPFRWSHVGSLLAAFRFS